MDCLKCNTPNEGICFWWCEELKYKIHISLITEFTKNEVNLKKSKKFLNKLWFKIKSSWNSKKGRKSK